MALKKLTKESRRIGLIILFLSVFMGFKPAIAQENITEVELNVEDTTVYPIWADEEPQFPGGDKALFEFLHENLVYPKEARGKGKKGIEGRVMIGFIVEKDGSLSNFEVIRTPDKVLSDEAIRVIKLMPKWIPGKYQGKTVRVKLKLPIEFKLN